MKLSKRQKKNMMKSKLQGTAGEVKKKAFRDLKGDIERYADEKSSIIYEQIMVSCMKVLRDDLGFGKKRLEKFMRAMHEQIVCINQKYVSVDDLSDMILRETKFDLNTMIEEEFLSKGDKKHDSERQSDNCSNSYSKRS